MKSILIVDDEIISRFNTKNILSWSEFGYKIVAEASNGEEALIIMGEIPIDLVITDIKMPKMSGIELIRKAQAEGINTQYIVLSSFDEYDYVREALVLGAIDYILKLDLTAELMMGLLNKANIILELQNNQQALKPDVVKSLEQRLDSERETLRQLLYGKITAQTAKSRLVLQEEGRCFIVISFDISGAMCAEKKEEVLNLVEDILHDYQKAYACMTSISEISILYNYNAEINGKKAERMANRIRSVLRDYYSMDVTMYRSELEKSIDQIASLYLQVCQARALRNIASDSGIVQYGLVRSAFDSKDYSELKTLIAKLRTGIEKDEWSGVTAVLLAIDYFFKKASYVNAREAKHFLTEITMLIDWVSQKSLKKSLTDSTIGNFHRIEDVFNRNDLVMYMKWLMSEVDVMTHQVKGSYLVRKVKEYLHNHYGEKIQIGGLAKQLDVSNSHLSVVFKRETGTTIKDYLLQIRMKEAENMLKNTHMQIQEIAWEVGCDNEHYFSTLFKQRIGMSPSEYRLDKV